MITLIKNVTIFDGKKNKITNAALYFDKKIIKIGNVDNSIHVDEIIDGTGCSCLPGLINMHVHIDIDPYLDFAGQAKESTPGICMMRAYTNALKHLKSGTTTIRSLGSKFDSDIELKNAIEMNIVNGPRVLASGVPLTMTGGHGHLFSQEVDGCDEVMKAARLQLKKGADVIKVFATGGGMTKGVKPGASQLSEAEMHTAHLEAKKCGKISSAHAQGNEGIKNAIRAGITTIEHGVELDDEAIDLMRANGTYLVATLAAPYNTVKHGIAGGIPEWAVRKNEEALIPHRESFRKAYEAGVKIAAGNDAGTPFNGHDDFITELELMIENGMSNQDAIFSATYCAAEALDMQDYFGSITVGLFADLLLVKGDPEKDIADLRKVYKVFKEGQVV